MALQYCECSVRGCNSYCWYDEATEDWPVTQGWLLSERGTKCPKHSKTKEAKR